MLFSTGFLSQTDIQLTFGGIYQLFCLIGTFINLNMYSSFELALNNNIPFYMSNISYIIFSLFILIIIIIDQLRKLKVTSNFRAIHYPQVSFIITCTYILFIPLLQPHYLILIVPFTILTPNWSWLFLTFIIQLSHYNSGENYWIILFIIYIPFFLMLTFEYLDKRTIKGWFFK